MNALEARKLANVNQPKLIEKYSKGVVSTLTQNIRNAVNSGEFSASTSMGYPDKHTDLILNKVKKHFEDLDYTVSVFKFDEHISFIVSWQK